MTLHTRTSTLRVASVPSSHVYVRHLGFDDDDAVRLPDPPTRGAMSASPWWPPSMLDPAWVEVHHDEFDVFHVHFGFDARSPAELRELVVALHRHGKPLVFTVHDLRNPQPATRITSIAGCTTSSSPS